MFGKSKFLIACVACQIECLFDGTSNNDYHGQETDQYAYDAGKIFQEKNFQIHKKIYLDGKESLACRDISFTLATYFWMSNFLLHP